MENNEFFKSIFGDKTSEEIEEENKRYEEKLIEENQPLTINFSKFAKGEFDEGMRNLYIVWRGKQALYVGISRGGIWNRWFEPSRGHIFNVNGNWSGDYSSPIGRAIIHNLPASMRWKIELRYISRRHSWDLEIEEGKLIHKLHPLFNTAHLPPLTKKELQLYDKLTAAEHLPNEARQQIFKMLQEPNKIPRKS